MTGPLLTSGYFGQSQWRPEVGIRKSRPTEWIEGAHCAMAEDKRSGHYLDGEDGSPSVEGEAILSAKCWVCHGRTEQESLARICNASAM